MLGLTGGKPGLQSTIFEIQRDVFWAYRDRAQFIAGPVTIDGTKSANPQNSPYQIFLFAGTLMGRVTSSRKYANSVLGLTSAPLGGGQTTLNTDVNTAAEIVRRIGASGTFSLTGPPTASGPATNVRTLTVTYSAVSLSTGAITISADLVGSGSGTNQVNNLVVVDSTGSGTFIITIEGISTGAITYSATAATLVTNINTALNAAFGTSAIVASGGSLAAIVLTFSGTGYTHRPVGTVTTTPQAASTGYTINGNGAVGVATVAPVGTAGVLPVTADEGEFIAGSMIGDTDGSQQILTLICDLDGIKVADGTNLNRVDAFDPQLLAAGGTINTGMIVSYPTDSGLQAYVKNQIATFCGGVSFQDSQM